MLGSQVREALLDTNIKKSPQEKYLTIYDKSQR